jgi:hypothetical protein
MGCNVPVAVTIERIVADFSLAGQISGCGLGREHAPPDEGHHNRRKRQNPPLAPEGNLLAANAKNASDIVWRTR